MINEIEERAARIVEQEPELARVVAALAIGKGLMKSNGGLTEIQLKAHRFICAYVAKHEVSPSFAEIAAHLNIASRSGVHRIVHALVRRGYVQITPGRARNIVVVKWNA